MEGKKYNLLKAASWYTIGNILIKGVNFFVLPIFTRLMSTYEYGVYSVYLSYLSIIETIILLGLSSTVAIAKYAKEVDFDTYMSTIISIPTVITVICILLVNTGIHFWGNILSMDSILWNCLLVSSASAAIGGIIGARLVIDGRYVLYMAYSAIVTVGNIIISLFLWNAFFKQHDVHLSRVYGSTIASVLGVVFLCLSTKTRFRFNRACVRHALIWGIPLLFHTVATVLLTQSDRILIRYLDSYSAAGIYAVATTISTIPLVLQQSLQQAWVPWFYERLESKDYKQIVWLNDRYIFLYGFVIAGFMLVSPDIIHIFTEQSYWPCVFSLVPLSICVFGELLYSIPTSVEYYNKKTKYIMMATLITVVLNLLLDIVFIKCFGYHGAAYATALSKLLLFLMHLFFSRRIDKNWMFSKTVVVLSLLILAVLNCVIVFCIDLLLVRYGILLLLIVTCGSYLIKNKNALLSQLKR